MERINDYCMAIFRSFNLNFTFHSIIMITFNQWKPMQLKYSVHTKGRTAFFFLVFKTSANSISAVHMLYRLNVNVLILKHQIVLKFTKESRTNCS